MREPLKKYARSAESLAKRQEYTRIWSKNHPEKHCEYTLKWQRENPEKCRTRNKRSYLRHREDVLKKQAIYYLKNKEKLQERNKAWKNRNPENVKIWSIRRRGLLRGLGRLTLATLSKVKTGNIRQYGALTCIYCNAPLDSMHYSLDHLVPISRGGTNDYTNLGISCLGCNCKKHTKTYDEFIGYSKPLAFMETEFAGIRDPICEGEIKWLMQV